MNCIACYLVHFILNLEIVWFLTEYFHELQGFFDLHLYLTRTIQIVFFTFPQKDVFKAVTEAGWDGRVEDYTGISDWSFTGSLLYSVTVITTIGTLYQENDVTCPH